MQPVEQAIAGARYAGNPGGTPEAALEQFYAAFNGRDLALMADNWAQTDEIALDNPLGGIRRGWAEIRPLYERMFSGNSTAAGNRCTTTARSRIPSCWRATSRPCWTRTKATTGGCTNKYISK